jgi:hypothetical protein
MVSSEGAFTDRLDSARSPHERSLHYDGCHSPHDSQSKDRDEIRERGSCLTACSSDRMNSVPHTRLDSNPVDPLAREPETTEPSVEMSRTKADGRRGCAANHDAERARPVADYRRRKHRCVQVFSSKNSNPDRMDGA